MFLPVFELSPSKPQGSGDRYFAYSPKLRRGVSFSSKLEYERALLLEFDPNVDAYCEQPAEVEVWLDGCWRTSRLDFWLSLKDGREIFEEVKYASELARPKSRACRQIRIQKAALSAGGKLHRVITEREICNNTTLLNSLRTLLREFDVHYPVLLERAQSAAGIVFEKVSENPGCTIDSILSDKSGDVPRGALRLMLMELIRIGRIDAELGVRNLSPLSRVHLGPIESGGKL